MLKPLNLVQMLLIIILLLPQLSQILELQVKIFLSLVQAGETN